MVTEKNFTVHTEVAGKKNLSETEINDLVRNSIRRARENAKSKTRKQLEASFHNTVMLNEVTSSPVKKFSWSSPEGSIDDDSFSGKPVAKTQLVQAPATQDDHDGCDVSSIDGNPKKPESLKLIENEQTSLLKAGKAKEPDLPLDQQRTPVHTNLRDVLSPQSVGSANKTFRSFFDDENAKPGTVRREPKLSAPDATSTSEQPRDQDKYGNKGEKIEHLSRADAIQEKVPCAKLILDTEVGRELQTIPESPHKFSPLAQVSPRGSQSALSQDSGAERIAVIEKLPNKSPADTIPRKPSFEVVVSSENLEKSGKDLREGQVIAPTRLEFNESEQSGKDDEEEVSEMANIVQRTMQRARKTAAEAVLVAAPETDQAKSSGTDLQESGSLHSADTKVVTNTFKDRLATPDLQDERGKRGALSMPPMLEDSGDDSENPRHNCKELPEQVLSRNEESFSKPSRSAIAFISVACERKPRQKAGPETPKTIVSDATKSSSSDQRNEIVVSETPKSTLESLKPSENVSTDASESGEERKESRIALEPAGDTERTGRCSRPLLSLKMSESSDEELVAAKKVRDSLSASLKQGIRPALSHSDTEDTGNEKSATASSTRRYRSRSNRRQRRGTGANTPALSIDTDTVITSELIAGLAMRKGETITADELNKLILETNQATNHVDDSQALLPRSPETNGGYHCPEPKYHGAVANIYTQFCMDFFDFFKFFDFHKDVYDDDEHEDFHSANGMETPMEESDEFEALQEVTEGTTTCDETDVDVNGNPRMTFSFSVAEDTSSSSATSSSSSDDSSNAGW